MAQKDPFPPQFPTVDNDIDPGGLIRESYQIDGLELREARSIFLDWAIKLDPKLATDIAIRRLLAVYAPFGAADHPMTQVLTEGLGKLSGPAARRGGSRARRS